MDREYIETGEYIIQVNKYPKTTLLAITDDLEKAFVENHRGSQRSGEGDLLNTIDGSILTSFGFMYETMNYWNTHISPGGSFIALISRNSLEILNGKTGEQYHSFDNIKVKDLKFSPDESKMLIITRDNTMSMINLKDFNDIVSKRMDDNVFIESFLFSPNGLNLLIQIEPFEVTPGGTTFQILDSNNLELKYEKDVSKIDEVKRIFSSRRHRNHYLTCQTFSPDGTKIAFGTSLGIILLFDSTNGEFIHSFDDQHTGYLSDISISPDGTTVAGLSEDIKPSGVWNIDGRAKYSFFYFSGDKDIFKINCFDNCIALLESVDSDEGQDSFNICKYYRKDDQEDIFRFQTTMNNHTKDPSETIFNRYLPIRNSFGSVVELVLKQEVDVAITLPDHKGYIIAKLNPAAAKQARKEMGLHKNYPLLFYKGKLVFKLEKNGYLVSASLREIIPSTTVQKLRDQIGLTPRTSSVSTQIMDSDDDDDDDDDDVFSTQTMDSDDDDDDDVSRRQPKRQKIRELEMLSLRF
jgi:hypothetical protein